MRLNKEYKILFTGKELDIIHEQVLLYAGNTILTKKEKPLIKTLLYKLNSFNAK